ncbi:RES family NAD+ phosphorylase [Pseudooceanicola aestuarii]|uniref:RES family NAD+ phosphorylase n=1 Tax=Pseudooceanicola aestuarii TaxID=2697319 RepID=UPI0013D87E32|nr:RES family NAD+ phosphorylase [Pseudooceanicola aestuarii]
MPLQSGRFVGRLYRALNPVYARDPLSGRGAALFGGRFNQKGTETLYTALDPVTALREANQVGDLQPTTLVAYRADLGPVFDTRDDTALADRDIDAAALADPGWRTAMLEGQTVPTQEFAKGLQADGYAALLVRSYAHGARADQLNMVLWRWNKGGDDRLAVIDDENRLTRAP